MSTQQLSKSNLLKRVFSDPKNYPYGFARSGDFSISESRALSEYGCLIAALVDGLIIPESSDDDAYFAAAHGLIKPANTAQRAWIKYQKRINRPKTDSIYGSSKASSSYKSSSTYGDDDLVTESDDSINLNVDD